MYLIKYKCIFPVHIRKQNLGQKKDASCDLWMC